jgi:flagellin
VTDGSVLNGSPPVELALDRTQARLATDVSRLSSGLRVQSAADDPSGLAIGTSLKVRAAGLDAGAAAIATASNALTVADGALGNVEALLQRIRTLCVEAEDDFNSTADLQDIDAEIQGLKVEINHVASTTQFNGLLLTNGAFDTTPARAATVVEVTPPQNPRVPDTREDLASGGQYVTDITTGNPGFGPPADAYVEFGIDSFDSTDNTYGYNQLAYSTDPTFGPNQDETYPEADGGGNIGLIFPDPAPDNRGEVNFQANTVTAADVGVYDAFEVTGARLAAGGQAADVAVGDGEGDTIAITIPGVSTDALDIENVSVLSGALTSYTATTSNETNLYIVYDSLYRVDQALQQIGTARAQVGAQIVALGDTAANSQTAVVGLTASASSILDANIGTTVTDFTQAQLLSSVGISVLASNATDAKDVLALFTAA